MRTAVESCVPDVFCCVGAPNLRENRQAAKFRIGAKKAHHHLLLLLLLLLRSSPRTSLLCCELIRLVKRRGHHALAQELHRIWPGSGRRTSSSHYVTMTRMTRIATSLKRGYYSHRSIPSLHQKEWSCEFISPPPKVHTFSSIEDYSTPKSVKRTHSATRNKPCIEIKEGKVESKNATRVPSLCSSGLR